MEYVKEEFIDEENFEEFEKYRADLKELTLADTVQDMLDYLVFSWSKIKDRPGLSTGKKYNKIRSVVSYFI